MLYTQNEVYMCWEQFVITMLTFVGLFVWNRTESRNDFRHLDAKMEENRRETFIVINQIQVEMKDFHERLVKLDSEFKTFLMNKKNDV